VVNVLARISGTAPTGAVVVVAHIDTVPETPGANDNASGLAVALETARVLLAGDPVLNDVILLFSDGEEPAPRYGSTAFVDDHRWFDDVRFVVNLEAIGTSGPSMLTETNGPQSWILDKLAGSAPQPVAFSFLTETTALIGGSNTDLAPFRDAGVPGVEFVYSRGSSTYHTQRDTPDSVSRRSVHSHGVNTVELVRQLASEDLASTGSDMVFFTVGRFHLVRYSTTLGILIAAVSGGVLFAAVRRRRLRAGMVRGAATTLIVALLAAIIVAVLWTPFAQWRNTMGVFESSAALLALVALTAALMVIPFKFARGVEDARTPQSVLLAWWILALITGLAAPGMSYLFALPALVGASALLLGFDASSGPRAVAPAVLTVGVVMVVLIPAIDTYFQFAQPRPGNPDSEILPTIAVPVLLVALGIQLAVAFRPRLEPASTDDARSDEPASPARSDGWSTPQTARSR
jgi:hypothetical protein